MLHVSIVQRFLSSVHSMGQEWMDSRFRGNDGVWRLRFPLPDSRPRFREDMHMLARE